MLKGKILWGMFSVVFLYLSGSAIAETFMGFECRSDCRGHRAGFEWARKRGIKAEQLCPRVGDRVSFYEGCLAFARNQTPTTNGRTNREDGVVHLRSGKAQGFCSRTGTYMFFKLEGDPIAEIIVGDSDFLPLKNALNDKYWTFGQMRLGGRTLFVLIHNSGTRIMFDSESRKGSVFVSKDSSLIGVNDLFCSITFV